MMGRIEKLIEKIMSVNIQIDVLKATPYEELTEEDKNRLLILTKQQRNLRLHPANDDPNWE